MQSLTDLPAPGQTSVSIITPPKVIPQALCCTYGYGAQSHTCHRSLWICSNRLKRSQSLPFGSNLVPMTMPSSHTSVTISWRTRSYTVAPVSLSKAMASLVTSNKRYCKIELLLFYIARRKDGYIDYSTHVQLKWLIDYLQIETCQ